MNRLQQKAFSLAYKHSLHSSCLSMSDLCKPLPTCVSYTGGLTGLVAHVARVWSRKGVTDTGGFEVTITGDFGVVNIFPCKSRASKRAKSSSDC